MISTWNPKALFGMLVNHTGCLIPTEGKFHFLQIVFIDETTSVKDLIMIWAQLSRVGALYSVDEIALSRILLERVRHWLVESGDKGRTNFLRTLFT